MVFDRWLGVTRLMYNLAKETNDETYRITGRGLTACDLQLQAVGLKREYEWMNELPKDTLYEPLFRYEKSMKRFFSGAGFPSWAKKRTWRSLVFIQQNKGNKYGGTLRIEGNNIFLHKKIKLKFFADRALPTDAAITRIILIKDFENWYASVEFKTNQHQVIPPNDSQVVGVDAGVARLITLSTGEFYKNAKIFESFRKKIRIEQRSLSRKKRGGANYAKQLVKLRGVYQKLMRTKSDVQHKITNEVVAKYSGFIVEDLQLTSMMKSTKDIVGNYKKGFVVKSELNLALSDAAIGSLFDKLRYKCEWNERYFEKVNPAYTSQECNICGHTSRQNRTTQSLFLCMNCGHSENADVNAAKNILKRGGHPHCSLTWNSSSGVGQKSYSL